jgi:dTDP-4-amino-4,6-dideoxygalactose transaminase
MEDAAHALPTYYRNRRSEDSESEDSVSEVRSRKIEDGRHPSEIEKKKAFHGVKRAEDGSQVKSERQIVGSIGDVTCFSFYANKTITTGEGGMLCTDDDDIAARVKVMRLHGINRDVWDRFSAGASWEYDVIAPGFKYNMPDINAALGIHQLKKVESFRDKRQRIAEIYYEELKDIPGLALPKLHCATEDHSWYLFNVLIEPDNTKDGIDRDSFIEELAKRDIGTSVHYKPLHRMTINRFTG